MRLGIFSKNGIAIGLACAFLLLACRALTGPDPVVPTEPPTSTNAPVPTATIPPLPTDTARPTPLPGPTDTPEPPSCYKWDQVTRSMAGDFVCVYGTAYSHVGQSRIDFSPKPNTFFVIDPVYYYPELSAGSCVVVKGVIEVFSGGIPFITVRDGLYKCESWMLE